MKLVLARICKEEQNKNLARTPAVEERGGAGVAVAVVKNVTPKSQQCHQCSHCHIVCHNMANCFQIVGFTEWWPKSSDTLSNDCRGRGCSDQNLHGHCGHSRGRGLAIWQWRHLGIHCYQQKMREGKPASVKTMKDTPGVVLEVRPHYKRMATYQLKVPTE